MSWRSSASWRGRIRWIQLWPEKQTSSRLSIELEPPWPRIFRWCGESVDNRSQSCADRISHRPPDRALTSTVARRYSASYRAPASDCCRIRVRRLGGPDRFMRPARRRAGCLRTQIHGPTDPPSCRSGRLAGIYTHRSCNQTSEPPLPSSGLVGTSGRRFGVAGCYPVCMLLEGPGGTPRAADVDSGQVGRVGPAGGPPGHG